jgi:hypothetical protein
MVVVDQHEYLCKEEVRLKDDRERKKYWKKWGPYVAERQWATGTFKSLMRVEESELANTDF